MNLYIVRVAHINKVLSFLSLHVVRCLSLRSVCAPPLYRLHCNRSNLCLMDWIQCIKIKIVPGLHGNALRRSDIGGVWCLRVLIFLLGFWGRCGVYNSQLFGEMCLNRVLLRKDISLLSLLTFPPGSCPAEPQPAAASRFCSTIRAWRCQWNNRIKQIYIKYWL